MTPTEYTAEQLLELLEQSRLIEPGRMAQLRSRVAKSIGPIDPERLFKPLVDHGEVTPWQADQLLAGRNAFFLGRYELQDCIGAGGMGVVFKAQHAMMDRTVALKVLARRLVDDPRSVTRFHREVKAAAKLSHPNIIAAHDAGNVGEAHFLVMEYVAGRDLNYWLRRIGPMPVEVACEFMMQAAQGLRHAHRSGMVHRDIKPSNLLVSWHEESEQPVVKILDMGVARMATEGTDTDSLTQTGQPVLGTADYVAPEAAKHAGAVDKRSDIFSLGCTLFKLLTGRLPFGGDSIMEKLMARAMADAPLLRTLRPDASAEVEAVLAKMLAREPEDRYQDAEELAEDLSKLAATNTGHEPALAVYNPAASALAAEPPSISKVSERELAEIFDDCTVGSVGEATTFTPPVPNTPAPKQPTAPRAPQEDLELLPLDEKDRRAAAKRSSPTPTPVSPTPTSQDTRAEGVSETADVPLEDLPELEDILADPGPMVGDDGLVELPANSLVTDDVATPQVANSPDDGLVQAVAVADPLSDSRVKLGARKRKKKSWDSPLLLVGGGGLLALILVGLALQWSLGRQGGDEMLAAADKDYNDRLYSQAITKYGEYLKRFPDHPGASGARVNIGLSRLRQTVESGGEWPDALATAKSVLDEIQSEDAFPTARPELTALLPKIAEGLAAQAQQEIDAALVDQASEALALATREQYAPASMRPAERLGNVELLLENVRRQLARESKLADALTRIAAAAGQGDTEGAYAIRTELIGDYPQLANNEALEAAVRGIAVAERDRVEFVENSQAAVTEDPEGPLKSQLALVTRQSGEASVDSSAIVPVLADGVAYGLEAAGGDFLWRRFVGFDTSFVPRPVPGASGRGMVLVDSVRNELLCVEGATGRLKWRQAMGEPLTGGPVPLGDQLLITAGNGRLVVVEVASGATTGEFQFPQALPLPPAVDPRAGRAYVLGEHSSLFIVSLAERKCDEVVYVGHDPSAVRVPPTLLGRYIVIAENNGAETSRLHVLLADEDGLHPELVQTVSRLQGHVTVPPLVDGRRLHVVTDRGGWYTYEVATPGTDNPLGQQVVRRANAAEPGLRYARVDGSNVWLAGRRLAHHRLATSQGRLVPVKTSHDGDTFLQPLASHGTVLFHVRRRKDMQGVTVTAVDTQSDKIHWETNLGTPLAGGPKFAADGKRLITLTVGGALYQLSAAELIDRPFHDQPVEIELLTTALSPKTRAVALGGDRLAFASGDSRARVLAYDPTNSNDMLRRLTLPDSDIPAGTPVAFAGGLLTPGRVGQVYLLDPSGAQSRVKPFQPRVTVGAEYTWHGPALADNDEALLADGRGQLFRVGITQEPVPHLAALAPPAASGTLVTPIAVLGKLALAVDTSNVTRTFRLPDLEEGPSQPLGAKVAWGPQRVGKLLLVSTVDQKLHGFAADGSRAWEVSLDDGPLAGNPVADEDSLLVASTHGVIQALSAESGEELARVETGQPLSSGPLPWGTRIVLVGHDGTIFTIARP